MPTHAHRARATKNPHYSHRGGFCGEVTLQLIRLINSLAVTYFRMQKAYYHRRWFVSRPCSRWEGVGPNRYGRQA